MKKVLRSIVAVALIFTMIGCASDESENKEEKKEFNIGEVATIEEVEYTVVSVEKHQGKSEYSKPKEGKEFVTVNIKIENKSADKVSYNPLDWKMVNANGQEEDYSIMGGDTTTGLNSGDLISGGKVEGTITYEQTVGNTGLKLNLYDNMFSEEAQCGFIIGG